MICNIIGKLYICLTLTICFFPYSTPYPVQQSDIIAGEDFLSLINSETKNVETVNDNHPNESVIKRIEHEKLETRPIITSIEEKSRKESILPIEEMFATTSTDQLKLYDHHHHHHHQYNQHEEQKQSQQQQQQDSHINDKSRENFPQTNEKTKEDQRIKTENIKVIAVSVSSSVKQSSSMTVEKKINPERNNTSTSYISKSSKTDFSVEDRTPSTRNVATDNVKSESTNVHRVVAAPSTYVRSRMQRKQDSNVPYQTVTYHDYNSKHANSAYSSTGDNSSPYSSWLDYERSKNGKQMNLSAMPNGGAQIYSEPAKIYSEPAKIYSEPSKIFSEPAKIYSEPAKIYGEPEKVYSEPAKIYSEPAKVYSEPAKSYGEPSKIYSEPAKIYYETVFTTTPIPSTTRKIIFNLDRLPYDLLNAPVEENDNTLVTEENTHYEASKHNQIAQFDKDEKRANFDEKTYGNHVFYNNNNNGAVIHPSSTESNSFEDDQPLHVKLMKSADEINRNKSNDDGDDVDDSKKVGYVLEGRNFRKYRVEEKTADGFIVGEYGIVSHNDGSLRGVRYTADSTTNPKLIYDALLKFLSL